MKDSIFTNHSMVITGITLSQFLNYWATKIKINQIQLENGKIQTMMKKMIKEREALLSRCQGGGNMLKYDIKKIRIGRT